MCKTQPLLHIATNSSAFAGQLLNHNRQVPANGVVGIFAGPNVMVTPIGQESLLNCACMTNLRVLRFTTAALMWLKRSGFQRKTVRSGHMPPTAKCELFNCFVPCRAADLISDSSLTGT